jgi:hypothetical protein
MRRFLRDWWIVLLLVAIILGVGIPTGYYRKLWWCVLESVVVGVNVWLKVRLIHNRRALEAEVAEAVERRRISLEKLQSLGWRPSGGTARMVFTADSSVKR